MALWLSILHLSCYAFIDTFLALLRRLCASNLRRKCLAVQTHALQ